MEARQPGLWTTRCIFAHSFAFGVVDGFSPRLPLISVFSAMNVVRLRPLAVLGLLASMLVNRLASVVSKASYTV